MNVLLIDDDADDAELIRRELDGFGIRIVWADGFQAGIELIESGAFDAVLVDQLLGVRTGLEFLDHARQARPDLPVFIVTGVESQEVDDAALEAGAAGFVLKREVRGDSFSRTLRYGVRHHRARPGPPDPKPGGKELTLQVALSRGMTIRDAAKAAGMSERTAYRRLSDPVFQEQLAALRTELRERTLDRTVRDMENDG